MIDASYCGDQIQKGLGMYKSDLWYHPESGLPQCIANPAEGAIIITEEETI